MGLVGVRVGKGCFTLGFYGIQLVDVAIVKHLYKQEIVVLLKFPTNVYRLYGLLLTNHNV